MKERRPIRRGARGPTALFLDDMFTQGFEKVCSCLVPDYDTIMNTVGQHGALRACRLGFSVPDVGCQEA